MDAELAKEVIQCLPKHRTLFRYYKGHFANLLLSFVGEHYQTVSSLKNSPFQRLTTHPEVKAVLASRGDGRLNAADFMQVWHEPSYCFRLTVGCWEGLDSRYDQVSRRGLNLVLQLNFSNQHNELYKTLYKPTQPDVFNYSGHPVASSNQGSNDEETLAWARIDLDEGLNEALIEEIQSDWVREAKWEAARIERYKKRNLIASGYLSKANQQNRLRYLNEVMAPYYTLWQEVMLAATLWFIFRELGIARIYTHTPEGGGLVKRIAYRQPPRSIYSTLPKRFCFQKCSDPPGFLATHTPYKRLAKKRQIIWQKVQLAA